MAHQHDPAGARQWVISRLELQLRELLLLLLGAAERDAQHVLSPP